MSVIMSSPYDYYINYEYEVENEGKIVILVFANKETEDGKDVIKEFRKEFKDEIFKDVPILIMDPSISSEFVKEVTLGKETIDKDSTAIHLVSREIRPVFDDFNNVDDKYVASIDIIVSSIKKWLLSILT